MAKEYKLGEKYYLPVTVYNDGDEGDNSVIEIEFRDGLYGFRNFVRNEPDFLLTATEIAEKVAGRRCAECSPMYEELKSRNAELEALLKEVMATRDEAIRQNDELITKNNELEDANCNLTKACSEWQIAAQTCADNAKVADRATEELRKENKELKAKAAENADTISRLSANKVALTEEVGRLRETVADRTIDVQHLTEENAKLKTDLDQRNKDFDAMKKDRDELDSIGGKLRAENENLTAWYNEANRTATEAAEANDELKAKIADLRNRVGEQLAQIQDLNAEINYLKAERDSGAKGLEEEREANKMLRGRYDNLLSINREQGVRIGDLEKTVGELKDENKNLSFLLEEDQPEEEPTKTVHAVLNDGTGYNFFKCTKASFDNYADFSVLKIYSGEEYVAGFLRGDKPMNLAYWWTE